LEVVLFLGGVLPETAGLADAGHHLAGPMAGYVDVGGWLPPGVQRDDEPIAALFERTMSGPKLGEVLFVLTVESNRRY
jgi:hypothetical protein